MITERQIEQAYSELHGTYGGTKPNYFGLLHLEREHDVPRAKALNQVAFGMPDIELDGFHFDERRRNLYLFQFKWTDSSAQFKGSLQKLIEDGLQGVFGSDGQHERHSLVTQLRSCIYENRALIDQVCFRFVFAGDVEEAERSKVLEKLRKISRTRSTSSISFSANAKSASSWNFGRPAAASVRCANRGRPRASTLPPAMCCTSTDRPASRCISR